MRTRSVDDGAAAVEFALVVPLLLLLVFGILDFGRAYQAKMQLTHAAREGVRVWTLTEDVAAATDQTRAVATGLEDPAVPGNEVSVTVDDPESDGCTPGLPTTLTATYQFTYLTPLPDLVASLGCDAFQNPFELTGVGVMRCAG